MIKLFRSFESGGKRENLTRIGMPFEIDPFFFLYFFVRVTRKGLRVCVYPQMSAPRRSLFFIRENAERRLKCIACCFRLVACWF